MRIAGGEAPEHLESGEWGHDLDAPTVSFSPSHPHDEIVPT